MKVFLGGTCNGSTWREKLMPELDKLGIEYFNPVVKDWTSECMKEEERQKKICDTHLYVITPKMKGVYSIAEVVEAANTDPGNTIFCVLPTSDEATFDRGELKSMYAVERLVSTKGVIIARCLKDIVEILEYRKKFTFDWRPAYED
jgi:hypothetical protein